MINARAEGIGDKPSFRAALKKRRCLVPANGYYEWKQTPGGKVPYLFRLRDREQFAFAGLYESWDDENGNAVKTYTSITTEPNGLAVEVHNRMPAILPRQDEEEWLDPEAADAAQVTRLLRPYEAYLMNSDPVSAKVGNPSNNDPSLIVPTS